MEEINKKELEKVLGYEIDDFSISPKFNSKGKVISFDIRVVKKPVIEYIETKLTILKSGNIKYGEQK